jgi:hypothetical protein
MEDDPNHENREDPANDVANDTPRPHRRVVIVSQTIDFDDFGAIRSVNVTSDEMSADRWRQRQAGGEIPGEAVSGGRTLTDLADGIDCAAILPPSLLKQ